MFKNVKSSNKHKIYSEKSVLPKSQSSTNFLSKAKIKEADSNLIFDTASFIDSKQRNNKFLFVSNQVSSHLGLTVTIMK
jgi:hypothetical protein